MNLAKKLVPAPLLSCVVLIMWIALSRGVSRGSVLLGLVLGLVLPLMTARLRATHVRVRRPLVALRYLLIVGRDVVVSNFQVARDIIVWRWRRPNARFVVIPLDLRSPPGLATLAIVTTIVPGTVWSEIALDRSALMLHVWDVGDDEEAFIAHYKARYEAPLREIFE